MAKKTVSWAKPRSVGKLKVKGMVLSKVESGSAKKAKVGKAGHYGRGIKNRFGMPI